MKVSTLINRLEKLKKENGNVDVCIDSTNIRTIKFSNIRQLNLLNSSVYKIQGEDSEKLYIGIS